MAKAPPPTTVRLDVDLREALERAASENYRTLTQEIIKRLRESLRADNYLNGKKAKRS